MKTLRANFVSCAGANCVNQHFEVLNPVDYGWKVSVGKLESNWFEGSTFSSIEDIEQVQNSTDNTFSDSDEENEDNCLSHSNNEEEPYWTLCE